MRNWSNTATWILASLLVVSFSMGRASAQEINVAPGGVATQSTTGFGGDASLGIDGNTSGVFGDGSTTHSAAGDAAPSWEVDLQDSFPLARIVIWNRTDACCPHRLSNFRVSVLDGGGGEVFGEDYFTDMTSPAGPSFEIVLPENTVGQIVRVALLGPNSAGDMWLSLAEVQAFALLADLPPVITSQPAGGRESVFGSFVFSVDAAGADTYQWQKDEADLADATEPALILNDLTFEDAGIYRVVLTNTNGTTVSQDAELVVTPINVARRGRATQSTTGFGGEASRAIDGNTSGVYGQGSTTHTDTGDAAPWWEVNLGQVQNIDSIVLWNRTDCCAQRLSNFRVLVLEGNRDVVYSEDFFTDMTFPDTPGFEIVPPEGTLGRIVRIEIIGDNVDGERWASLAEVEVFNEDFMLPEVPAASVWSLALLVVVGLGLGCLLLRRRNSPLPVRS